MLSKVHTASFRGREDAFRDFWQRRMDDGDHSRTVEQQLSEQNPFTLKQSRRQLVRDLRLCWHGRPFFFNLRALSWFLFDPLPTRAVQSAPWCVIVSQNRVLNVSVERAVPIKFNWTIGRLNTVNKWVTWTIVLLGIVLRLNLVPRHLLVLNYFIFNKTVMFLNLVLPLTSILLMRGKTLPVSCMTLSS